jgi:transcriptional regulator with XRE-family HTH domain
MTLGHKMRSLRLLKGLTQENMAEMLKVSLTIYGKYERDEARPPDTRLQDIAATLGVTKEKLENLENSIQNIYNSPIQNNIVGSFLASGAIQNNSDKSSTEIADLRLLVEQLQGQLQLFAEKLNK